MDETDFSKRDEQRAFWFLVLFAAPIIAVIAVGGYGLLVWLWQIVTGPPGA